MSDFEQWALNNGYCHRDLVKNANGDYCTPMTVHGFKAFNGAIASMQGEAVGVVTLADDISQPDTSGEHKGKYQNMIYSHEPLQVGAHVFTYPPDAADEIARQKAEIETLYTTMMAAAVEIQEHWDAHCDDEGYGPANLMHRLESGIAARYGYDAKTVVSMEAEIARLTKELEEVRKVPEGYAVVPIEPTVEIAEAFQKAMLKEFGMQTTLGYHKRIYKSMLDAAIRQIGGAE